MSLTALRCFISLTTTTGTGGLPRGRVVEMYGPESSGKTTVALHVIAEAQKMGGWVGGWAIWAGNLTRGDGDGDPLSIE